MNQSMIPIGFGIIITAYFLWECFNYHEGVYYEKPFFQFKKVKYKRIIFNSDNYRVLFVFFIHIIYAWCEKGILFSVFGGQILDASGFSSALSYFSIDQKIYLAYVIGLFWGGLFFDFVFRARILSIIETILIKFYFSPADWKGTIHKWTVQIILAYSVRRIPFYRGDTLISSSFGFYGRDTDLRRRISRIAFGPTRETPGIAGGKAIIGEDRYRRSAPDITRVPWFIHNVAVEATHDLVDEIYRTKDRHRSMDDTHVGILEGKVIEWIGMRRQKISSPEPVFVKDRLESFNKSLQFGEDPQLELGDTIWISADNKQLYAGQSSEGVIILPPDTAAQYSNLVEFSQKQNARHSPLHRGPILRYIDFLIKTRSPIMGWYRDFSTRQQQHDLYRARLAINDYIMFSRRYSEFGKNSLETKKNQVLTGILDWRKQFINDSGGIRSRSNRVYSQQYIGNLQLVRRLFAISWSSKENSVPFHFNRKEKIIHRRKISLDQITFDQQKTIFEHEEIGKVIPLKIRMEQAQKANIKTSAKKMNVLEDWVLKTKHRFSPDSRVDTKPIYAGWDSQRHAFVLCNRFLPFEWSVPKKFKDKLIESSLFFDTYSENEQKKEEFFKAWPQNFKTRRINNNVRFSQRAILHRRVPTHTSGGKIHINVSFLSLDPSFFMTYLKNGKDMNHLENDDNMNSLLSLSLMEQYRHNYPSSLLRSLYYLYRVVEAPVNLHPSIRGGVTWPGINHWIFIPETLPSY
jgi:hypothetical protein